MKKILLAAFSGAIVLYLVGCGRLAGSRGSGDNVRRYTDVAMGTIMQQTLYYVEETGAEAVSREVMDVVNDLEQELISWRAEGSELYEMNASAGAEEGILLSAEMAEILKRCMDVTEESLGSFDVSLGAVVRLWNIDSLAAGQQSVSAQAGQQSAGTQAVVQGFALPGAEELAQALEKCGADKLVISGKTGTPDAEGATFLYLPEGMQLDLGAVGKGIALEEIHKLLQSRPEITGAVISAGGSILTYGTKPDGSSWKVGIVNPLDTAANIGVLSLEGQWCVSTSGDYERYVEVDGVRYHHIIDPKTGYPVDNGVRGVTILCKDGLLSDALSTACFILGPEEGMELAESYGAEVLFVLSDGEIVKSEGMKKYFNALK